MELDENSLMNIPNLRRSKRIIQKVNKLNNINKITKAHIHSPQKKKIKKVIKKNIDKTINARSTIESDNLTEVSTPISSLKLNNKRKEISRKYSNKDDNDCTPKIIRNKTKISKKANVSISKNLKSLTPKPNAQKKNPIHLRNTKSFIDKVKSSSDTTSTNNNFNFYSNVEQDNDFGNNNLDYMMKLATDIDAFRSHFERFDELTKNNNIVFSKNNDNKLIPKEVEFNDDDLSSSPSHSCNIFTETTTHIISSDTGLATSMESFQLLSSDPVEPEDSFWLPKSLTSFNNQNSVSPNQSLKSFNDKETSFLKDKNSNNNLFTPFNSNIFDNSNKSDTFNEEENDATPIKSYKSSNIFLNYEFSKQKKDITPSINTSNIFLNYELTKQEKNKTTIDNLFLNCFHEDSQNSFNVCYAL
ncbi:hypothetical protein BCR36DRAFT_144027 [Piromyces finnis]|uniref:Uncharacterized protein n=1 Tax=Piromyces finnis TaxID=1754191 RepID=A0A1Y1UZF8_9FUNG|nr:hypothetical protein BCR36DRAFT_144027 [Piromyces finnis]|eukprot:ORX43388.1 hypothetical protein BCR36DRAFT_144027 [Piromyces finnis]